MSEVLEIIVLLNEFPDGIILGRTRPFAINFFKKNSDLYVFDGTILKLMK